MAIQSIHNNIKVLTRREHYAADFALVVRQLTDDQETTLQVRRVVPDSGEELQIEISVIKIGAKRNMQMHSSFVCSPQIADMIADACKTIRARKE